MSDGLMLSATGSVNVSVTKFEVQRFNITSSRAFEVVVAAIEAAVGHPICASS